MGKGDGVYLNILNDDGSVKDWKFMQKWIELIKLWAKALFFCKKIKTLNLKLV